MPGLLSLTSGADICTDVLVRQVSCLNCNAIHRSGARVLVSASWLSMLIQGYLAQPSSDVVDAVYLLHRDEVKSTKEQAMQLQQQLQQQESQLLGVTGQLKQAQEEKLQADQELRKLSKQVTLLEEAQEQVPFVDAVIYCPVCLVQPEMCRSDMSRLKVATAARE